MAQKPKKSADKKEKPTRRRKSDLAAREINHFKQLLLEKWNEIVGDVNSMESGALKKSRLDATGDLSSMPIHMADIGTDNYEQEFALGLLDSERKLLREIYDALQRIEQGRYGICEGTGKPIPKARLEATPWARYCVEYARLVEQGRVSKPREAEEPAEPEEGEEEKSFEEVEQKQPEQVEEEGQENYDEPPKEGQEGYEQEYEDESEREQDY